MAIKYDDINNNGDDNNNNYVIMKLIKNAKIIKLFIIFLLTEELAQKSILFLVISKLKC